MSFVDTFDVNTLSSIISILKFLLGIEASVFTIFAALPSFALLTVLSLANSQPRFTEVTPPGHFLPHKLFGNFPTSPSTCPPVLW